MNGEELSVSIVNRDFARAQDLIAAWGDRVRQLIRQAPDYAERKRIYDSARSFAASQLLLAQVIRAQMAADLDANSACIVYANADSERHHWQMRG